MELFGDILREIFDNFNSAGGKAIVGSLINFFMLIWMVSCIKTRYLKGLVTGAVVCLASTLVFTLWASVHPGYPGFVTMIKMMLAAPAIVFVGGAVFIALFGGPVESGGASSRSQERVIYDQYGRPIELRQVGAHYEDNAGNPFELHGDRAVAQERWMETEDGRSISVLPDGNGNYTSYGHTYHLNSRGKLEEW